MAFTVEEIRKKTRQIVEPWRNGTGGLIPILQQVQHEIGYLPEEALETISLELKIPPSEIYGVATFYAQFHLKPRGRHVIRVCRGTACHVRGSLKILNSVKEISGPVKMRPRRISGSPSNPRPVSEPAAWLP
ncbi:hypothetical protein MASR1M66_10730 [Aminivibrio sp.]